MYLCFENIPRTGTLANITCQEYLNATDSVGSYKVAVLDLKTLATLESCVPVFTSALYEEARVFCHQFRNSLEGIDTNRHDDKFFMSWSGKRVFTHGIGPTKFVLGKSSRPYQRKAKN